MQDALGCKVTDIIQKETIKQMNKQIYCVTPQSVYKTIAVVFNAQMAILEIRHI